MRARKKSNLKKALLLLFRHVCSTFDNFAPKQNFLFLPGRGCILFLTFVV